MKIGITIPTLNVAGGVKCLVKVGQQLSLRGHDVKLLWQAYSTKNYLKSLFFKPEISWTEEVHRIQPLKSWQDIPNNLNVVLASSWRTATAVSDWAKRNGKKALYYIQHEESIWDGGDEAAATYTLELEKVVISSWLKELMQSKYGQKSQVLVTPVDDNLFDVTSNRKDRGRRVLMLHHNFDWKAFDEGIRVVEMVKRDIPDLQCVVLGGREEHPDLPDYVEYHFKPDKARLEQLYADCGLFLCPSWHEGLGMPSMEAMATGALLVTTDTGGSRDFARHGETAIVSEAKNYSALAVNLKMALLQWDSLSEMREEGRKQIRSYNWISNIDILEDLLKGMANV